MTAVSADGYALSVVCDGCGRTVRRTGVVLATWAPTWAHLREGGWIGSSLSVGDHYCSLCQASYANDAGAAVRHRIRRAADGCGQWLPVEDVDGVAVLVLGGELDVRTDAAVEDALARAAEVSNLLLLSMANVNLIDSTIIGTMVDAHRRVEATGGRLALLNPPTRVQRILNVLGLAELFPVFKDLDEALAQLRAGTKPGGPPRRRVEGTGR
jgi:anti-anti-sigma factor